MKVFVTGATGFVGGHVLLSLRKSGHSISALVRPGSEGKLPFMEGLEIVHGDAEDPAPWKDRLKGVDAVIHLVGIIREFPKRGVTFEKAHYEATMSVLEAASAAGARRFIHMSANGAADDGPTAYQETKRRAERLVEASGLSWTIFRPSVIFGDPMGKMDFVTQLASVIAKAPVVPVFGNGEYRLQPIHAGDVASCFVKALVNPAAEGQIFHLCGADAVSFHDIIQIVGKAMGRVRTRTMSAPFWLVKPAAALLGGFEWFPVTADQLTLLRMGNMCPESHYRETFNMEPVRFSYQNLDYVTRMFKERRRR
ncbi:MAG: complex I NDUFA9 subunit family protein [Candidatus Nitrospinota bacterium M3_3B_026]